MIRPSLRSTILELAIGVVLAFVSPWTLACDCNLPDVPDAVEDSQLVFSGKVTEVDEFSGGMSAHFHVDRIWKGSIAGTLAVSTTGSQASCGFPFRRGARYIVYAHDSLPQCEFPYRHVSTTSCTRTEEFNEDEAARLDAHLGGPIWTAPPDAFQRGDVNSDGQFDLSDPVGVLLYLFGGALSSGCLDVFDINDSGDVDLSDAIFGLNFLFFGGPTPPAPGPNIPGFDGTTDDPFDCGDDVELPCDARSISTLPGVRVEVVDAPCELTLEEAAAGIHFAYRVVAEEPLRDVKMRQLASCQRKGPGGFLLLGTITGVEDDRQRYCLCDLGRCLPVSYTTNVAPGSGSDTLFWCGRNWFGPSDTMNPVGEPFPPGTYRFEVRAEGTWVDDGNDAAFTLSAAFEFELVP